MKECNRVCEEVMKMEGERWCQSCVKQECVIWAFMVVVSWRGQMPSCCLTMDKQQ